MSWDDNVRAELLDGMLVMMALPSRIHQEIIGELFRQIANFLKGKPCKVYPAPFGVRLDQRYGKDTVFEPDIVVVCDESKLDDRGCDGAPDLVVEILSASSARYDKVVKFNRYLQSGVREYWIVDPDSKTISVNLLENGKYVSSAYDDTDTASVSVLPGCAIILSDVFPD